MNDSSASTSYAFFAAARTCFARLTSAVDGAVGGALRLGAAVRAVAAAGEDAASSETRWWVAAAASGSGAERAAVSAAAAAAPSAATVGLGTGLKKLVIMEPGRLSSVTARSHARGLSVLALPALGRGLGLRVVFDRRWRGGLAGRM